MYVAACCSRSSATAGYRRGCAVGLAIVRHGGARDARSARQLTLTPCSSRYFFAPGWNGIGEPSAWLLSSMFLRLAMDGDELRLLVEHRLDDGVGHLVAHLVVRDEDVPDVDLGIGLVLSRVGAGRE